MTLDEIFLKNGADKGSSWHNYSEVYEELFEPMRLRQFNLMEIGVQFGASIKSWLEYFPNAHVTGVDILHDFKFEAPRYRFIQCHCGDKAEMARLLPTDGFEIIIDDGSHFDDQQKESFEFLWPQVAPGGMYIIEDWFTTYDPNWRRTIDGSCWLRDLIAALNWNGKFYYGQPGPPIPLDPFEKTLDRILLSKGLVVIKKRG